MLMIIHCNLVFKLAFFEAGKQKFRSTTIGVHFVTRSIGQRGNTRRISGLRISPFHPIVEFILVG